MVSTVAPITYYPVPLQKQFAQNQALVTGMPYESFFTPDIHVPAFWAKAIQDGQMPLDQTLTPNIEDINRLLDPSLHFPDAGYAVLDGPTAYIQSRIEMPGVTTEMFKWWFLWHPLERERYMLWFPYAHIDNFVEDPQRLANQSLSFEERLYHNPNHIEEFIGPLLLKAIIHFCDPIELGLDAARLQRAGFTASASAICYPEEDPDAMITLMLHLARDTDRGLELFNRYWIGAHPAFNRFPGGEKAAAFLAAAKWDQNTIENVAYEMSVHDMTEFNHLAHILPLLYQRWGG